MISYAHCWWPPTPVISKAFAARYRTALRDCRKLVERSPVLLQGGVELDGGIVLNGIGVEHGYEDLRLPANPYALPEYDYCKTARLPYDVVVTACLAVMAEAGLCV